MIRASLLVLSIPLVLAGCMNATPERSTTESRIVLQSNASWDKTPYRAYPQGQPELTIQKVSIPANTALQWHRHAAPNAGYVLSGQLTIELKDRSETLKLNAGDALAEVVDIMHRGVAGSEPVELLVFYAGSPGMPLSY